MCAGITRHNSAITRQNAERSSEAPQTKLGSKALRSKANQITTNCGRGTMNLPVEDRYSRSRALNSSTKCHGNTKK